MFFTDSKLFYSITEKNKGLHIYSLIIFLLFSFNELRKFLSFLNLFVFNQLIIYFSTIFFIFGLIIPYILFDIYNYKQQDFFRFFKRRRNFNITLDFLSWVIKLIMSIIPFLIILNIVFKSFNLDYIWLIKFIILPGIFEEIFFRGIILVLLLNIHDAKTSILLSSSLFGLMHITNYFTGTLKLVDVLFQIIYTYYIGCFLALILIKNRRFSFVIILHTIFNLMFVIDINHAMYTNYRFYLGILSITYIALLIPRRKLKLNLEVVNDG